MSKFNFIKTDIPDVQIIEPTVFGDDRGYFMETYQIDEFAAFGKWVGAPLSADNKKMLWIPEGFAHGFVVLSDVAEFCYKCTDVYDPTAEGGIPYDDPTVNVQWPDCGCEHKTSAKDKEHTPFAAQKFEYFEKY